MMHRFMVSDPMCLMQSIVGMVTYRHTAYLQGNLDRSTQVNLDRLTWKEKL